MTISYRPGLLGDSFALFQLFAKTVNDLCKRNGVALLYEDEAAKERDWRRRQPLFDHLAETAEQFWVAEEGDRPVGYARTIMRDGVRQLTEYFVDPETQSGGIGSGLLSKVFPDMAARHTSIIATTDTRAQVRYLKLGTYPHFPIQYMFTTPKVVDYNTDLRIEKGDEAISIDALAELDKAILGFRRDPEHKFFLGERDLYLYYRGETLTAYAYTNRGTGPIVTLEQSDFPAILAHLETEAANRGQKHFGMEVPLINKSALAYFWENGYRLDDFVALLMMDQAFGKFEHYIVSNPPFFL